MTGCRNSKGVRLLPLACNAAMIVLELVGTSLAFAKGGLGTLKWFTVLSNILALISSIAFLISYLRRGGKVSFIAGLLRYFASCCLALTFLTVIFVLVPMAVPGGTVANVLFRGANLYHHLLCPILSCLSFIFAEQGVHIDKKLMFASLAPTMIYAVVFVILNIARVVKGPYPFLRVYEQPWYMSVVWAAVIGGLAAGSAWLIGRLRNKAG
ncbi:MAG: hypothetical protein IKO27_03145 [Ruminococcus sp.]|nr:hypothetical protein [Ruminococcus sp.]